MNVCRFHQFALAAICLLAGRALGGEPKPFTIAVIGDTQNYVHKGYGDLFENMVRWIAQNAERRNIVFVTQEGDLVQNSQGNLQSPQWLRAHRILSMLDRRVAYSVSLGDHDYDRKERFRAGTSHFVHYFGEHRYAGQPWYGGAHPMGTSHYQYIKTPGRTFLHLNLECDIPGRGQPWDHAVWAQTVIDRHPGMPTIVTTHSYVTDARRLVGGRFIGRTRSPELLGRGRRSGEQLWQDLIRHKPQIFLVLGGNEHLGRHNNNGEYYQISYNDAGLPVIEVLTNHQGYERGGDGWLRLITFDESAGQITFHTYSPTRRQFRRRKLGTPTASQFALNFDFGEWLGPPERMPLADAVARGNRTAEIELPAAGAMGK